MLKNLISRMLITQPKVAKLRKKTAAAAIK